MDLWSSNSIKVVHSKINRGSLMYVRTYGFPPPQHVQQVLKKQLLSSVLFAQSFP